MYVCLRAHECSVSRDQKGASEPMEFEFQAVGNYLPYMGVGNRTQVPWKSSTCSPSLSIGNNKKIGHLPLHTGEASISLSKGQLGGRP